MHDKATMVIQGTGCTIHHPVWVATVQDPYIFGMDFLSFTVGQLDLKMGTLKLQEGRHTLLNKPEALGSPRTAKPSSIKETTAH
ncbi:UNVERIFIED_CONTAM: hypothetical protein FKN15_068215 [Acipenser sinensis]